MWGWWNVQEVGACGAKTRQAPTSRGQILFETCEAFALLLGKVVASCGYANVLQGPALATFFIVLEDSADSYAAYGGAEVAQDCVLIHRTWLVLRLLGLRHPSLINRAKTVEVCRLLFEVKRHHAHKTWFGSC